MFNESKPFKPSARRRSPGAIVVLRSVVLLRGVVVLPGQRFPEFCSGEEWPFSSSGLHPARPLRRFRRSVPLAPGAVPHPPDLTAPPIPARLTVSTRLPVTTAIPARPRPWPRLGRRSVPGWIRPGRTDPAEGQTEPPAGTGGAANPSGGTKLTLDRGQPPAALGELSRSGAGRATSSPAIGHATTGQAPGVA